MLHQFFAFLLIVIVILVLFFIKEIVLPIWRFMVRATYVLDLYPYVKNLLEKDFSLTGEAELSYDNGVYNRTLYFSNTDEVIIEFEKIVQEALEYYDRLGQIAIIDSSFNSYKRELLQICSDIRIRRWQKQ